jgi:DNA (cytosine-5)-methyltransferase 1
VQPFYYCAANVIDWSLPTPRIGERKKPLKPKTMARIQTGLERFYGQSPFAVQINKSTDRYTQVMTESFRTQTADNGQALVTPFLLHTSHAGNPENWVYALDGVAPTQTTRQDLAMASPPAFSFSMNHRPRYRDISGEPFPTQTTYDDTGLVVLPNAGMLDLIAEYVSAIFAHRIQLSVRVEIITRSSPFLLSLNFMEEVALHVQSPKH